jgi:hypothetical protein
MFPSLLKKRKGEKSEFIVPIKNLTIKSVIVLEIFFSREQCMLEVYCRLAVNENEAALFNKDFLDFFMLQS